MKIRNLARKLALTLIGLGWVSVTHAADLQTNLVVNSSFEDIDDLEGGPFGSFRLFDWDETDELPDDTFAYPYDLGYSGTLLPPGAGDFHFTGGFDVVAGESIITQTIPVDSGDTSSAIANGDATYYLSAFFTSYRATADSSSIRIQFLDDGNVLGEAEIGGADFLNGLPIVGGQRYWGQDVANGVVPAATTDVQVDIVAAVNGGNHDAYIDLVDFRVGGLPNDEALVLRVDEDGVGTVVNETGSSFELNYYEILSPSGALNSETWNSLEDQDFEQNGAPGTGNGWEQAGGSSSEVLSEAYLLGSSTIRNNQEWNLGTIAPGVGGGDLVFRYGLESGLLLYGIVDAAEVEGLFGDTNGDGTLDSTDIDFLYAALRGPNPDPSLDLNGDAVVDTRDVDTLVLDILNSNYGDSDENGVFNSSDFVAVFVIGEYEDDVVGNSTWADGDWNGDADFNSSDLVFVFQKGSFVSTSTASVPEPAAGTIALVGILMGLPALRRSNRSSMAVHE